MKDVELVAPSKITVIEGSTAASDNTYFYFDKQKFYYSKNIKDVLNFSQSTTKALPLLNDNGIVFLLKNSLIPYPYTPYKNIFSLGPGDVVTITKTHQQLELHFKSSFPYKQSLSRQDQKPSTSKLLQLLARTIEKNLGKDNYLMLSSGKDSVALAVAIREASAQNKVISLTYTDTDDISNKNEAIAAKAFAKKLGILHETIKLPNDKNKTANAMRKFFTHSPYPSCDPTTIPYIISLNQINIKNSTIFDGLGNDIYTGYVSLPKPRLTKLLNHYSNLTYSLEKTDFLNKALPFYSKARKIFLSPAEQLLYGHNHFSMKEISYFRNNNFNPTFFWDELLKINNYDNLSDFCIMVKCKYFDGCGVTPKVKYVPEAFECTSYLPWSNPEIQKYVFNLKTKYRYDSKTGTNKILIRQMLKETIDYDANKIGKQIFHFNAQRFILRNKMLVKEEILECSLWNEAGKRKLGDYLKLLSSNPRIAFSLLDLFMISGWHNHCKYLRF